MSNQNIQGNFYNSATADMTYNQVVDLVGRLVTSSTNVTIDQFYTGMNR